MDQGALTILGTDCRSPLIGSETGPPLSRQLPESPLAPGAQAPWKQAGSYLAQAMLLTRAPGWG